MCDGCWTHVPSTDKVPSFQVMHSAKGKAYERNLDERVANIQRLLKENPVKEQAIKEEKEKRRSVTEIQAFLKKNKLM
jgi:hypothetical protein